VFGIVAGLVFLGLIFRASTLSMVGAGGIIVGGVVVYFAYGRSRTDRTGAIGSIIEMKRGEEVEPPKPTEPSKMSDTAGDEKTDD
jgi:APA family basic amino acid/polyamine antiporter